MRRAFMSLLVATAMMVATGGDATAQDVPGSRAEITLSFAPVVREAAPAVVNIYARRIVAERARPLFRDPFFGDLFRDFGSATPRVQNALGSGVILSPDGIVVSNHHVVGEASEIRVVLADRREYAADLVLSDAESDLAVLRLRDAVDLPVLELQDSDQVEVGELVLAIGNPFGIGQTVSSGIVSGLARSGIAVGSGRGYFIQTDAAINPGNSGGALVDMAGRLVGINTAIITPGGGSVGIGFAIPSNLVAQVVAQARDGRASFVRPWAGMTGQGVDAALAEAFDTPVPEGVVVLELHPASPLVAAGLMPGDIVLSVDGAPVNSAPEMMFRLTALGLGQRAELEVRRNGTQWTAAIDLIAAPEEPPRASREVTTASALRGLRVESVNPAVIVERGLPLAAQGVVVAGLRDIAARTGLQPGDIILQINGTRIDTTADVLRMAETGARNWQVEVLRDGRRVTLRFRV